MTIVQVEQALLFDSNIYLVIGSEKAALIDAGTGFQVASTISSVEKVLGERTLDYMFITHRHYDHVGGLSEIIDRFHPSVFAGEGDAVPLREGDSVSTLGTKFGGIIPKMDVNGVKDGDKFDLGDHVLRIIETPGHTIGSICLFDEVTESLFSGDLFFFDGVGRTDLPTASSKDSLISLGKLKSIKFKALYSGHGPIIKDGGPVCLDKAIRQLEMNLCRY